MVDRLRGLGAVFVDELDQVPDGATVIFCAHGVSSAVEDEAARRGLAVFDATCPLVTKVHMEVGSYARDGLDVILIGHAGHPEVEGTMGRFDSGFGGHIHLVETVADAAKIAVRDPARLAVVTQTTLSVDDTAKVDGSAARALSYACDAAQGRHLLRDAEPAGCGQAAGRAVRRDRRGRARAPVRIPIDCARLRQRAASRATSWMGQAT